MSYISKLIVILDKNGDRYLKGTIKLGSKYAQFRGHALLWYRKKEDVWRYAGDIDKSGNVIVEAIYFDEQSNINWRIDPAGIQLRPSMVSEANSLPTKSTTAPKEFFPEVQPVKNLSNISQIIEKYESLFNNAKKMYVQSSNSISGYFRNESLDIGVNGFNKQDVKEILIDLEQHMEGLNEADLLQEKSMSDLIETPGIKTWLVYYQTLSHETFHLLQSLTLQATAEYVYWIRQFREYEFIAFAHNLSTGGGWNTVKHKSILDIIPNLAGTDFGDWFNKTIIKNSIRLEMIESYAENTHGVSTFELVEGSAVAFQELVTHSVDININNFSENGLYTNAYNFFLTHGGNEVKNKNHKKIIFLFICHTALYYGSVSNLHSTSEWDDPVKLFINLCQFVNKYEKLLNGPTILYSDYRNFEKLGKKKYSVEADNICNNSVSSSYIESIQKKLSQKKQYILSQHINLLDKIRENVCVYFSQNDVPHMYRVRQHLDRKMKPLYLHLSEKTPLFGNFYFIAFLLSDIELSTKFIHFVGSDKLSEVKVKTANGKQISNGMDSTFLRCMADFKDYLQTGAAYCCDKHGYTSKKRLMVNCDDPGALRRRIQMFGDHVELKDVIIFE